jgi:saccharopine dehydrogenase (NADP+, L-glutamate forming)
MGLDPGIDHMSAMRIIQSIKDKCAKITSFKSHCGGLISPESDDNPWHYKITWNPRNVVLAGKDGGDYRKENKPVHVPYRAIFQRPNIVEIPGMYPLSWYVNRDSFNYIPLYGLDGISTFIRTTLRHPAFCRGWNKIVNIGFTATDDFEYIKNCKTFFEWYDLKLRPFITNNKDWNFYLQLYVTDPFKDEFNRQINYLGLRSKELLPAGFTCSADILQHLMETKLAMHDHDSDMIIMHHEFEYELEGKKNEIKSTLIVKGENQLRTAMAKTVGLPLGIAAKLILQEKIKLTGLHIPTAAEIYDQVLPELELNGIKFTDN